MRGFPIRRLIIHFLTLVFFNLTTKKAQRLQFIYCRYRIGDFSLLLRRVSDPRISKVYLSSLYIDFLSRRLANTAQTNPNLNARFCKKKRMHRKSNSRARLVRGAPSIATTLHHTRRCKFVKVSLQS